MYMVVECSSSRPDLLGVMLSCVSDHTVSRKSNVPFSINYCGPLGQ